MERMELYSAAFVDAMRKELIQRVNLVEAVADVLLQERHISSEEYSNITEEPTNQRKMRELYKSLNSTASKAAFYKALQEKNRFLLEDLEKEFRETGAAFVHPMRKELIQGFITQEQLSNIRAEPSNKRKTREFHGSLNYTRSKAVFYEALQENKHFLLEDLQKEFWETANITDTFKKLKCDNEDAAADTEKEPATQSNMGTGPQKVDNETRRELERHWQRHRKDNKYNTKFQDLLKDPQLRSLGNGKLFFCKKEKYKIGRGAEGTHVYIGMRYDGTEIAVKRMVSDNYKQMEDEMKVLRDPSLEQSQNIVRYLDFTEDEDFVYLCLQLCEYDFEEYKTTRELDQDALKKVTQEVLLGLQALHKAHIIHRDIKPSNILIDVQGNARLADFGICRMVNQGASTVHTSRAGTRGWEAAEILKANPENPDGKRAYKRNTDIQVAGMLVYYILSGGEHPFGPISEREVNILEGKYNLDKITDVEAKDLIEKMLAHEPHNRLTVKEAVEHPYFWDDAGRRNFLRIVGDKKCIQEYKKADAEFREDVKAVDKDSLFSEWQSKITYLQEREKKLAKDLCGLLRFLRNRLVHDEEKFNQNDMYKDLFPNFYIYANQLAKRRKWNKDTNWE